MIANKKAKILIILSIILLTAFAGCTAKTQQTVPIPGGNVKVVEGSGPNWCKAGTKMMTADSGQQVAFEVKGIVNYEGKDVCQSDWSSNDSSMTIYTNEDSSYYIMITKDKTGKVINTIDMSQPKK